MVTAQERAAWKADETRVFTDAERAELDRMLAGV